MTVSSTVVRRQQYNGNGSTTDFPVPFVFFTGTDLKVVLTDSNGVETPQTITTDYTVAGGGVVPATGTVTFLVAPSSGNTITIYSEIPLTQSLSLTNAGQFDGPSLTAAFDKQMLAVQDAINEKLQRAILFSPGSTFTNVTIGEGVANYLLRWNDDIDTLEAVSPANAGVTGNLSSGPGIVVQTDTSGTYVARTLTAGSGISISNGSGVNGNPTISAIGGGSGGGATVDINQAAHGFVVGEVLYLNGSTYTKARANVAATAEYVGMVSAVTDVDNFRISLAGRVEDLIGLTAGTLYFVDPSTAGAITATEPTTAGHISKPVGVADSTTSILLLSNMRGLTVGSGLAIGTDVQAWSSILDSLAALSVSADTVIYATGATTFATTALTSTARSLLDDTSVSAMRTTLGLGTIVTQDSSNVTITGGSVTGITDITVADGGTGRSSHTAYAVLCGGTTGTGAQQSIASVGTAGQVLTSNGASALPTFQGMSIKQRVSNQTGAAASGTTQFPSDDTIPQNTEGDQYMTQAITPTSSSSILVIDVSIVLGFSSSATFGSGVGLFQDSTTNAIAAVYFTPASNNSMVCTFRHIMTAGTTSATTFKIRAGIGGAGTTTFNGSGGTRIYGGVMASSMMITEYSA